MDKEKYIDIKISKDGIVTKIKEVSEKITGKPLSEYNGHVELSNTKSFIIKESVFRFDSLMKILFDESSKDLSDTEIKENLKDNVHYTMSVIFNYYIDKLNYETISRLYRSVCEIYSLIAFIDSETSRVVFGHIMWMIYIIYCSSMDTTTTPNEIEFIPIYDDNLLTININNQYDIEYVDMLMSYVGTYSANVSFGIKRDINYFDALCEIKLDDPKEDKDENTDSNKNMEGVLDALSDAYMNTFNEFIAPDFVFLDPRIGDYSSKNRTINNIISSIKSIFNIYSLAISNRDYSIFNKYAIKIYNENAFSYIPVPSDYEYSKSRDFLYDKVYDKNKEINEKLDNITNINDILSIINDIMWLLLVGYTTLKDYPSGCLLNTSINFNLNSFSVDINIPELQYHNTVSGFIDKMVSNLENYIRIHEVVDGYRQDIIPSINIIKKPLLCIVGEIGSGEYNLVDMMIEERGINKSPVVSYTNRPQRDDEDDGIKHHFVSRDYIDLILNREYIASYTEIGDKRYSYCTLIKDVEKSDIYIISPDGLNYMKDKWGNSLDIITVYIDCPLEERRKRLKDISDSDEEFEKRINNEKSQFEEFRKNHEYDYIIDNGPDSSIERNIDILYSIMQKHIKNL